MQRSRSNIKAIENAAASVRMEGLIITPQYIDWCIKLLNEEITMSQYIEMVKNSQEL